MLRIKPQGTEPGPRLCWAVALDEGSVAPSQCHSFIHFLFFHFKTIIEVNTCTPVFFQKGSKADSNKSKKIFVGGIPHNCGEPELRDYFNRFGVVSITRCKSVSHSLP